MKRKLDLRILIATVILIYSTLGAIFYFNNKILPRVRISSIDVSGMPKALAKKLLDQKSKQVSSAPLIFTYQDQTFAIDLKKTGPKIAVDEAVDEAFVPGHSQSISRNIYDGALVILFGKEITPKVTFENYNALLLQIGQINLAVKKAPIPAKINLGKEVSVTPASAGLELDQALLLTQIQNYLNLSGSVPTTLSIKSAEPKFTTDKANKFKSMLENIKDKPLTLSFEKTELTIDQETLLSLMDIEDGKDIISQEKLVKFMEDLSLQINRPVQDAKFIFNPGTRRVQEFQPALPGQELDIAQTANLISTTIATSSGKIALPVKITHPKNSTSETNSYGITGLLGKGLSNFSGSIENRIYNIKLAASRINGVLIAPGNVFSFNRAVGDISAASGYKQAYVIKGGRTVLDDGGGVCQVSTTLFRAVLNSGLPVVKRTAHAYRVGYYEQGFPPGLDATVFAPSVDFQFKNDTGSYILIQAHTAGTTITIDLYGAPDGRVATISTPVVTNQTPPPPELRQDDPALPKGTVKQVDWPAWGANVTFYRTVKKGGETIISEKWTSAYKPWQAIYLVGTKD